MTTTRRWLAVPVVAAALVGAGACGGDGGSEGTPTTLGPESRARAVNLELDDLPPEFAAVAEAPPGAGDAGVGPCVPGTSEQVVAEARTPVFQRSTAAGVQFVRSRTAVVDDEAGASGILEAVRQPATIDCLRDAFAGDLVRSFAGATVQTSTLELVEGAPEGEGSVTLSGSVTFTTPAAEQPLVLPYTLALVRTDEVVTLLLFGGLGEAFPADLALEATRVVAERQTGS